MAEMIILTSVSDGDSIEVELNEEKDKIVMSVTKAEKSLKKED